MNDFKQTKLPNFQEPENINYRNYYRIEKHELRSRCPWGYSRWISGKNGKLIMFDSNWDSSG